MNKILLTAVFSISISISFSQALYFNVSGGYGAPALQQTQQAITFQPNGTDPSGSVIVPLINQNISDSSSVRYKTNQYQGYTTGGTFSLTVGYFINPYVGFEVGFSSLIPQKIHGTSTYDDYAVLGPNTTIKTTTWSYGITMSPGIRLHACKPDAKIVPYGRFALSLPLWGATKHELDIRTDNFYPSFYNKMPASASVHSTTKSVFSIGFNGSIGVGYNITKWVRIYGEVAAQYLFVRSGKTTLTKYDLTVGEEETEDQLKKFRVFSKETVFVDELNENSNTLIFDKKRNPNNIEDYDTYVNEDKPREELRRAANFSAFGGMIGFAFTINNKMWKKKQKPVPVN